MKKLIPLILLIPAISLGALTNIVVNPAPNPDTLGNWATKINATIDQVNSNTPAILKKDGSVAMTGDLNMGGNSITNFSSLYANNMALTAENALTITAGGGITLVPGSFVVIDSVLSLNNNTLANVADPSGASASGQVADLGFNDIRYLYGTGGANDVLIQAAIASAVGATNASQVSVADAGGFYESNTVEGVLYELGQASIPTGTWSTVANAATNANNNAVVAVVRPDDTIIWCSSLREAATNAVDGSSIEIIRSFTATNPVCFTQSDLVFNGNMIPFTVVINDASNQHFSGHPAAIMEFEGNGSVFNDMLYRGIVSDLFPSNLNVYALNLDITTNLTFNNCHLSMEYLPEAVTALNSPKVFVSVTHSNIVYNGGSLSAYVEETLSNGISLKLIDTHATQHDLTFFNTDFFASANATPGTTTVFNFGNGSTTSNDVYQCRSVYETIKTSAGEYLGCDEMTLASIKSLAYPAMRQLFSENDIPRAQGYSYKFDDDDDKLKVFNGFKLVDDFPNNMSSYLVESATTFPYNQPTTDNVYMQRYYVVGQSESAVMRSVKVADGTGERYYLEWSGLPFNAPYEASKWAVSVNGGTVTTHFGDVEVSTDASERRLIMTSASNITVTAGTLLEVGNFNFICDKDQTSTAINIRKVDGLYATDWPSGGTAIVYSGTNFPAAFTSMNMTISASQTGFYRTDDGIYFISRQQHPNGELKSVSKLSN